MKLNPAQQLIAEFEILMENREAVVAVAESRRWCSTPRCRFPFAAALKGISLGDKRPKEDTYGAPHEYTGAYTLGCEICGGHYTGEHAWEPRTEK